MVSTFSADDQRRDDAGLDPIREALRRLDAAAEQAAAMTPAEQRAEVERRRTLLAVESQLSEPALRRLARGIASRQSAAAKFVARVLTPVIAAPGRLRAPRRRRAARRAGRSPPSAEGGPATADPRSTNGGTRRPRRSARAPPASSARSLS